MKKNEGRRTYAVVNLANYFLAAFQEGDPEGFRSSCCSEAFEECFGRHYAEDSVFELNHKVLAEGLSFNEALDICEERWGKHEGELVYPIREPFDPDGFYRTMLGNFREKAMARLSRKQAEQSA